MAQPIYCDLAGCQDPEAPHPRLAVWMVQRLDGSLAEAYCDQHWPVAAIAYADQAAQAAGSSLAELLSPPEPGPDEPTDEPSDEPVAEDQPLEGTSATERLLEGVTVSSDDDPDSMATAAILEDAGATVTVRRGTSRSRRAHEARKRAKAGAQAEAPADA